MDSDAIIAALGLEPHPEGGHYRETWRHEPADGGRGAGTAIYYLLSAGEISAWHRLDVTEIWHFYSGAPLEMQLAMEGSTTTHVLGPDLTLDSTRSS